MASESERRLVTIPLFTQVTNEKKAFSLKAGGEISLWGTPKLKFRVKQKPAGTSCATIMGNGERGFSCLGKTKDVQSLFSLLPKASSVLERIGGLGCGWEGRPLVHLCSGLGQVEALAPPLDVLSQRLGENLRTAHLCHPGEGQSPLPRLSAHASGYNGLLLF